MMCTAAATTTGNAGYRLELSNIERIALDWDQPRLLFMAFITPQQIAQQAIAAGTTLRWNADAALGTPISVSYSFVSTAPVSGVGAPGFRAFSAAEQQLVRKLLAETSALSGISFTEVSDSATSHGQIRFGMSQQAAMEGGRGYPTRAARAIRPAMPGATSSRRP